MLTKAPKSYDLQVQIWAEQWIGFKYDTSARTAWDIKLRELTFSNISEGV